MANRYSKNQVPPGGKPTAPGGGVFSGLALRARLIIRLMLDGRVNIFLKLIPVASLAYLINPIDLPTPLDDIGVLWLGLTLFVELCPQNVVEEHMNNLRRVVEGEWSEPPASSAESQVIDAEFRRVPPGQEETNERRSPPPPGG